MRYRPLPYGNLIKLGSRKNGAKVIWQFLNRGRRRGWVDVEGGDAIMLLICSHGTWKLSQIAQYSERSLSHSPRRPISLMRFISPCSMRPVCVLQLTTSRSVRAIVRSLSLVLFNAIFSFNFRCGGQTGCDVPVDSTIFGDPCPGTFKYVEVHYACRNGKAYIHTCTIISYVRVRRLMAKLTKTH